MKLVRRIVGLVVALVLVLSLAVGAGAEELFGNLIISNAIVGETYSIYRVFDLESVDYDKGLYAYKKNEQWKTFEAPYYFTVDESEYVVWTENSDVDVAELAQLAAVYADKQNISLIDSIEANDTSLEFASLEYGYYLVRSSAGNLCALVTLDQSSVEISEKNSVPSMDSQVQEDSDSSWGMSSHGSIGDRIPFRSVVTVQRGITGLTYHAVFNSGFTLDGTSIKVQVGGSDIGTGNYTANYPGTDEDTLTISFTDTYIAGLNSETNITITYDAILDKAAATADATNESWVTYGDGKRSVPVITTTKTFGFSVFKYETYTQGVETPLEGAEFILYTGTGENKVYVILDGGNYSGSVQNKDDAHYVMSDAEGNIQISGLDADVYYLEEMVAPNGYNKLKDPVKVTIKNDGTVWKDADTSAAENNIIKVENKTGALLPSTGGMGTTVFYVLGAVLMLGAAVLLVVRKRMGEG